jgi:hypothetical protein
MPDDPDLVTDRDRATAAQTPGPKPPVDELVLGVIAIFMAHSVHVEDVTKLSDSVTFRDPATNRFYEVTVRPMTFPIDPRD